MIYKATLLCEGLLFPETPRWHRGSFYCCSMDDGIIYRIGADGSKEIVLKLESWVGSWMFTHPDRNEMVINSGTSRQLLHWDGKAEKPTVISDLSDFASFSINDMIRTPAGVTFIGSVCFNYHEIDLNDLSTLPKSPLLRVDAQGNVSIATDEIGFGNGMVITPDGKHLIVADSLLNKLDKWEITEDGYLTNRSVFASVPDTITMPDGICRDAEGAIWVASANTQRVYRVLEGGEITDIVEVGDTEATACMLGGENGRTLLITTSESHEREVFYKNPTGRLFTAEVKVPGEGLPSWYE